VSPVPVRLLLDSGAREPPANLALDEALARINGHGATVRLWRNERCVVLGRAQIASAEVDASACRELGVPVYRRFSGGGAVYHDPGNLNVSLVLPRGDPLLAQARQTLRDLYGLVLEPLRDAARLLGCDAVAGRDLLVGARKVGGVAAWQNRSVVLVHATLLVDADLDALGRVLAGPGAPGDPRWEWTRSRRVPVTSLAGAGVPHEALAGVDELVTRAFARFEARDAEATARAARPLRPGARTRVEDDAARALLERRYARPAWHASGIDAEPVDRAGAVA
jgi:lipoate-protein ligase A